MYSSKRSYYFTKKFTQVYVDINLILASTKKIFNTIRNCINYVIVLSITYPHTSLSSKSFNYREYGEIYNFFIKSFQAKFYFDFIDLNDLIDHENDHLAVNRHLLNI